MAEQQTTITVSERTLQRFKDTKAAVDDAQPGSPDHTADSFLNSLLDTWEAVDDGYYADADTVAAELKHEIERLDVDGALLDGEADRILNRIDDLENRLPKQVAEELRQ